MGEVFLFSQTQLNMIKYHVPRPHGKSRVDDLRVISGIIDVIRQGLHIEGCTRSVWSTQDAVQPICALEPSLDFQRDLSAAGEER